MSKESPRPYIGGQAVIEGVMMRSPGSMSIVCRRRNGELMVRERPMVDKPTGAKVWPFFRGITTVVESLKLGSGALRWSAELFEQDLQDEEEGHGPPSKKPAAKGGASVSAALALSIAALATTPDPIDEPEEEKKETVTQPKPAPVLPSDDANKKGGGLFSILPIVFAIGLFVAAPQLGANLINKAFKLGLEITSPGFQAITGAAKLLIVVSYMLAIRRMPEVRRVFQYHGAEHKTITTYEAKQDLLVENARPHTTAHPRCGTTFLVMVAMVSIVIFSIAGAFFPKIPGNVWVQNVGFFLMKLPFLPVVAAITYEIQRIFARYCTTGPLRALLWPGFLVQKITTAEPDDQQLEVALASLRATLWREAALTAPAPADRTFSGYGALVADPGYARG